MSGTFELNFYDLFEIDTTPDGGSRTWARLGRGISGFTPNLNENKDQTAYLDGNGWGSSDVIGKQLTYDATGHRVVGDTAQDYIAGKYLALGDDLKTNFRAFNSRGATRSGVCTINNIVIGGGDAQGKKEFSFSIDINGQPASTDATAAAALTATVAVGSATGTTKFTATPGAGNTLAYKLTAASVTVYQDGYPGLLTAYTSGADIPAAVNQYLGAYELNSYGRVVKYYQKQLVSGDIKA